MIVCGKTDLISLDDLLLSQHKLVGGKAVNLSILKKIGLNVPEGFIVPFTFYEQYLQTGSINPDLIIKIINSFHNGKHLAVRSSANIEDSLRLSYAGQFHTSLNIINGSEGLEQAVKETYNSARDYNRNAYGKCKKLPNNISMGLVVQEMISNPLCSGVIFTLDPTNGDKDTIVINYKQGLGEELVSGKDSGKTIKIKNGDLKKVPIDNLLSAEHLSEIVETSKRIEDTFGLPQDIEFTISGEKRLYFLQSRPITAYCLNVNDVIDQENKNIAKLISEGIISLGQKTLFSNSNIIENFPEPTPMGFGIFDYIFAGTEEIPGAIQIGRNELGYACHEETYNNRLFVVIGGKPFMDFTVDALTFRLDGISLEDYLSGFVSDYLKQVNEDPSKGNYPEGGLYVQHPTRKFIEERFGKEKGDVYFRVYEKFHERIKEKENKFYLEFINDLEPKTNQFYQDESKIKFEDLNKEELLEKFNQYLEYLRTKSCVDFVKVARLAFFGYNRLKNDLDEIVSEIGTSFLREELRTEIERELVDNENNQEINIDSLDNQKITRIALDLLLQSKPKEVINETEQLGVALKDLSQGLISVDSFLSRYGHVGQLEISLPRYAEEKEYFNNFQKQEEDVKATKTFSLGVKIIDKFEKRLESQGINRSKIDNFIHDATMANIYLPLRETAKMSYFKVHYLAKKCLIALSKKCGLEDNEIYMLKPLEISEVVNDFNSAFKKIKYREAYTEALAELDLPNIIFEDTKIKRIEFSKERGYLSIPGEVIRGGITTGTSLVARTNIELVKKYDQYCEEGIINIIGIFPAMDPSYGTRSNFVGLITQFGGPLAHAAIIARDNKIPYLTNVQIRRIPDKAEIKIDGTEGKIYVKK